MRILHINFYFNFEIVSLTKPLYREVVWEHNNHTIGANITWGKKSYSSDGVKRDKVWESKLKYKIYFLIMFNLNIK